MFEARPDHYDGYQWDPLWGWVASGSPMASQQPAQNTPHRQTPHSPVHGAPATPSAPLPPHRPDFRGQVEAFPVDVPHGRQRQLPQMNIPAPNPRGPRELPPMDIGIRGGPDLGAQIRNDMMSEARVPLAIAKTIMSKNPMHLMGLLSPSAPPPAVSAERGTPIVPETQPSYWGPDGGLSVAKKPSLDDIPILDVVKNESEFFDPTATNQASALIKEGRGREAMHPIYGPNANRPNYGEGLPKEVRAPFQSGPDPKSVPYWKTYVKNMQKGPLG